MRKGLVLLAFLGLIVLSIMPFGVTAAAAATPAGDVVDQINAIRAQYSLKPLAVQFQLSKSAQPYAQAMATGRFFSHLGLDGSTMVSRDEAAGYINWSYLEENLAAGQPTANDAVSAWMASPDHRANILSPYVSDIGIGYVYLAGSPYGYYWVADFGSRRPETFQSVS
ncbi:MAG TPA: CAP domain-containing protein, partial [Chloroflexota bacterium]|nr:CAP domain-containing protein [Chloroflexota bacterium]